MKKREKNEVKFPDVSCFQGWEVKFADPQPLHPTQGLRSLNTSGVAGSKSRGKPHSPSSFKQSLTLFTHNYIDAIYYNYVIMYIFAA